MRNLINLYSQICDEDVNGAIMGTNSGAGAVNLSNMLQYQSKYSTSQGGLSAAVDLFKGGSS